MKLLLIEDDPAMQTTLQRAFTRRGMHVIACSDGGRALNRWQSALPDIVVLDLSLPGRDGLDVLAAARGAGLATPVLVLTARGTVGDRVLGLDTGADDYLAKPFDLDELEARVRALGRRAPSADALSESAGPTYRGLRSDDASGVVWCGDRLLDLTPREAAMLRPLIARGGQALAKERLFDLVFPGATNVQPEAVEVVAYRLRKKLAATGVRLVTLRGLGYLLAAEA